MSITQVENIFKNDLQDLLLSDFIIDSEDVNKVFQSSSLNLYTIKNPMIKINVIKLEEEKNHRISSFTISQKDFIYQNDMEWKLLKKIEIDCCLLLLLTKEHAKLNSLDDWLDECRQMKELYNVNEDGRMCITSGFGPGVYSLFGIKDSNNETLAIKMTFIKEDGI